MFTALRVIAHIKQPATAGDRCAVKDKRGPFPDPCKIADDASPAARSFCFLCSPVPLPDLKGDRQFCTRAVLLPQRYKPVANSCIHVMVFLPMIDIKGSYGCIKGRRKTSPAGTGFIHKVFKRSGTTNRIRSVVKDRAGSLGSSNLTPHYPDRTDRRDQP